MGRYCQIHGAGEKRAATKCEGYKDTIWVWGVGALGRYLFKLYILYQSVLSSGLLTELTRNLVPTLALFIGLRAELRTEPILHIITTLVQM